MAGLSTQVLYNISSPAVCKNDKLAYLVRLQPEKFAQVHAQNGAPDDPDLGWVVQNARRASSINQFESMCDSRR